MAKDIPGDLKRAKYLSAGLTTLGVAATPLVALVILTKHLKKANQLQKLWSKVLLELI